MSLRKTLDNILSQVEKIHDISYTRNYEWALEEGPISEKSISRRKVLVDYYTQCSNCRPSNAYLQDFLLPLFDLVFIKATILVSIDIGGWDQDQKVVTEMGISIFDSSKRPGRKSNDCWYLPRVHIIIQDQDGLNNGEYSKENYYTGGESLIMKRADAIVFLQHLFHYYFIMIPEMFKMKTVLVGHGISQATDWPELLSLVLPRDVPILDIERVWSISSGSDKTSIKEILDFLVIPYINLQNPGNDAFYTLIICLELCDPKVREKFEFDANLNTSVKINRKSVLEKRSQWIGEAQRHGYLYISDVKAALKRTFIQTKSYRVARFIEGNREKYIYQEVRYKKR